MILDLEKNNYLYVASIKSLDHKDKYDEAYNILSLQRKQKVDKLISLEDKKRSILAEVLLRQALNNLSVVSNFEYEYNEYGKPYLKNNKDIHFNISHSGKYVICALSNDEVGCDIQEMKDVNIEGISKYFTDKEYSNINNSLDSKEMFYRYWVAKESYMKLIGNGFFINPRDFEVSIDEKTVMKNNDVCFFKEITIKEYKCYVCLKNHNPIIINTENI